jgi:protein-disulfide isomerase
MSAGSKKTREQIRETGRARRKLEQEQAARRRQFMFLGGVLLVIAVGALIATLVLREKGSNSSNLPAIVAASTSIDPSIPQNGATLGDPNAKVTVVEWGDFQCPYCMHFARDNQAQLIADYVKTGKIKFEFKNFPFIGPESVAAAKAAACAADQNKFWAFHDALYANQGSENSGAFSDSRLAQIASVAGLDMTQYNTCLANKTHDNDVAATTAEAKAVPITSTPSFVVNGKLVVWSNYNDLKSAIDAALTAAGA